ncbi:putative holin [Serratia sp. D1N4]
MGEPSLTVIGGITLAGTSAMAPFAGIDYGVVFGAFIGAMYFVTRAKDISHLRRGIYFVVSFGSGVLGAGVGGDKLEHWLNYSDKPLDALGALIISAIAIELLQFVSEKMEDPASLLAKWRGGSNGK